MNIEIWQQLMSLESRDIVQKWYKVIHKRELNVRRAKEINYAAKQAREYFRNSEQSNFSVKPLLTFYGVASLSRALILLLNKKGGEESLNQGHGLETINWANKLSATTPLNIDSFLNLKIKTCSGLFSDLINLTKNHISIHINSSGVDWSIDYDIPPLSLEVSFKDLLRRIPDLQMDFRQITEELYYAPINSITYSNENGLNVKVHAKNFEFFKDYYTDKGYKISLADEWYNISCTSDLINSNFPLFIHSYIKKQFQTIPVLYLSKPFSNDNCYSQISITYLISFFLGMLVRYFPTQWISLTQGDKGDGLWPTINRAQFFIENTFPELVIELINDILKENDKNT